MRLFSYPLVLTCVLGAQKNCLIETVLLSTYNICLGWEIRKTIFIYTLLSGGLIWVCHEKTCTVESRKFKVLGTSDFIRSIESSNYREVDIRIYNPQKWIIISFFQSNTCFVCVKETSQGDVSFMHTKHVFV